MYLHRSGSALTRIIRKIIENLFSNVNDHMRIADRFLKCLNTTLLFVRLVTSQSVKEVFFLSKTHGVIDAVAR